MATPERTVEMRYKAIKNKSKSEGKNKTMRSSSRRGACAVFFSYGPYTNVIVGYVYVLDLT